MDTFHKAPRLFLALFVVELGWLLNFIGVAIAQSDIAYDKFNPFGLQWYFLFVYLAFIILVNVTVYTDSMKTYKHLLMNLNTLTLAFIPFDLNNAVSLANSVTTSSITGGSNTRIAGLVVMVIPLLLIATMFGSEEDSWVNQFDLGFISPLLNDRTRAPKAESLERDAVVVAIERPEGEAPRVPPSEGIILPSLIVRNSMIKHESLITKFKAKTLYSYTASVSDPNEISFKAGEILEVIDSEGKWWQVVKTEADGSFTTGIAPSNYLERI